MELYARLQIGWINNENDRVLCESLTSNSGSLTYTYAMKNVFTTIALMFHPNGLKEG